MIKMLRQSIRELRNTREGISALFCVFAATRPDRVAVSAPPMPAVGLMVFVNSIAKIENRRQSKSVEN